MRKADAYRVVNDGRCNEHCRGDMCVAGLCVFVVAARNVCTGLNLWIHNNSVYFAGYFHII